MERVEIRTCRILGADGESTVAHTVFCPLRHESKLLVDCETCDRCTELTPEESFVVCEVPHVKGPVRIGEVMSRDVLSVTSSFGVEALGAILLERNLGGVAVVDEEGFPIGVVSKTDLLRADLCRARASEIMSPVAFTLEETLPLGDAIKLMTTENVHRLPVVGKDGRVAGILSTMDVLRWLDR